MKKVILILMAVLLAYMPIQAQVTNVYNPANDPWQVPAKDENGKDYWLCFLILGAAATAGYIIFQAYTKSANCCTNKRLILEKDHFDGNWTPVATNDVLICTNKTEIFRDRMTDSTARYRVIVTNIPQ